MSNFLPPPSLKRTILSAPSPLSNVKTFFFDYSRIFDSIATHFRDFFFSKTFFSEISLEKGFGKEHFSRKESKKCKDVMINGKS